MRSRLEEEWNYDTLSSAFLARRDGSHYPAQSTAKVHLIRSDRTVAELQDPDFAQQNPQSRFKNQIHKIFARALKVHGGIFDSRACPVVAGLILDSHHCMQQELILGHAALGSHNEHGLSLGMFGSHLTYAWPRFLEEVPDCLLDTTCPGDTVGNDNGECLTMWEACSAGQGAFLHEVGHAFSASHTTGIMGRGYSQHWPRAFLAQTGYCAFRETDGIASVKKGTPNEAVWDMRDAVRFKNLLHFRLASDKPMDPTIATAAPKVELVEDEDFLRIFASCKSGLAQVRLDDKLQNCTSGFEPVHSVQYTLDELEAHYDRSESLTLQLLGMNGKECLCNVWDIFSDRSYLLVPGTSLRLQKKSIGHSSSDQLWKWAVMLKKKSRNGTRE